MTQASIRLAAHSRAHRAQHSRLLSAERFRISPLRRLLDVTFAATALLFAVPVLAVAALLIVVTDGRPVFFTQARVGEGGREFRMRKLRSMRVSTAGAGVTTSGDPRITRVGSLLRALSIDELPQLWHVLRGQMTLVGPRPESADLARRYPGSCRFVLQARPGLTGPAQLSFRESAATPPVGWRDPDDWYLTVLVPLRTQADLEYLLHPSLGQTLRWLWATARLVLGHGLGITDVTRTHHPNDVVGSPREGRALPSPLHTLNGIRDEGTTP